MARLPLIAVLLCAAILLAQPVVAEERLFAPSAGVPFTDLFERLAREPLPLHEPLRITRLTEDADMSALLVQVRGVLPPHLHRRTREVLYLIQGQGLFRLGTAAFPLRPGSVVRVEPGQVHTFSADSDSLAVFFVVTTPRWDESDRVVADDLVPGHK